ncbi:hypothetical protein Tco_0982030 [Tanacetum coccineum]
MLNTQEFIYTLDMFRDILHLPVETLKNQIVTPVNIETIEAFMNKKFPEIPQRLEEEYHSIKDDTPLVSMYTTGNVLVRGTLIPDVFLTEEIRVIDDLKEYETVFMNVDVPMNQPQPVVSTQGTHRSTPRAHRTPTLTASPQGKKWKQSTRESSSLQKSLKITIRQQKVVEGEKDDDDSADRLEPGSHKDNPEHVDDDDDKDEEKVDEDEGGEMGSLETRTEEMQTPILTPPRSPRTILSLDKNITQELTNIVPLPTTTTSNTPYFKRRISSKYSHLPGALHRMCRRQWYMIQNMERQCVTTKQFWKTHKQVNQVLHEGVSQLAEKAIEDLIENNLKPYIAATIIEDRDAFRSEVPDLVSQEFNAQAPKIIEELFKNYVQKNVIQVHPTTTTLTETTSSDDLQQQLYIKMKRSLQDQSNDPALWEVLKRKFEKSSTSNTSYRDDNIHAHHDDHQEDDASSEGEKRVKRHKASKISKSARGSSPKHSAKDSTTYVSKQQQQQQEWDAWVEETVIDEDEVILEDETPELITKLQDVDKRVPTIFDYERMKATLNDVLSNQFKNESVLHIICSTNNKLWQYQMFGKKTRRL